MATRVIRITPTSYVGTTAAADAVIFNPTEIEGAVAGRSGGSSVIESITVIDKNDNTADDLFLYFFQKGDNDLGTLGSAVSISDANLIANKPLGSLEVRGASGSNIGDLVNLTMASDATDNRIGILAEYGSTSTYIAAVAENTSFVSTADGLEIVITFRD